MAGDTARAKSDVPPGMVLGPDGKPCKVCTGFRAWAGLPKGKGSKATTSTTAAAGTSAAAVAQSKTLDPSLPKDCPADVERLGRHTWTFLHSTAAYYPNEPSEPQKGHMLSLLKALPVLYPCGTCAGELGTYMKTRPPDKAVESRDKLEQYLCQVHNEVNERLGKEQFDCERVGERWRDGWRDGRCDA